MKTETYLAGESPKTGSTGPNAEAISFGTGAALSTVGNDLETGGRLFTRALKIKETHNEWLKSVDDQRWAASAYEQEKRGLAEFMANDKNNRAEDFAQRVDKYANDRFGTYTGDAAPSKEALDAFKSNFETLANSKYEAALGITYQNKLNGAVTAVKSQVSDAINAYRAAGKVPGQDGLEDLSDSVAHIGSNIEAQFREKAPNLADDLQTNLTTQTVLASLDRSPEAAKTFLDNSTAIDEQTRRHLNGIITQAVGTRSLVDKDAFNNVRANFLTNAEHGKVTGTIPLKNYQQFLEPDQAQVAKAQDDRYLGSVYTANGIVKDIAPLNANAQVAKLSELNSKIATKQDQDTYDMVTAKVRANIKLQNDNPVGWLQQNNPQVAQLRQAAMDASPDQQAGAIKNLNDAVLKYQGTPPEDVSPAERAKYLNKPLNDRHLLGTDEAVQTGGELNQSTPKEFMSKLQTLMGRYPGQEYTVFNDLASQGHLRQEYQLAWQNQGAWWLDNYLGAIHNQKGINVPEAVQKDITRQVDANPIWLQFQSSMIGPNFGRANEIQGFRQGIETYAQALVSQGKSSKDATAMATKMLISETLGFTKVNGRPLSILRDQGPGLPPRSDAEVADIGNRLGQAIKFVDVKQIDQSNFASLQMMGSESGKEEALSRSIRARGFFQTGNDGQSASLYFADDNGSMFQVRDKKGQPFNIAFKDLPAVTPNIVSFTGVNENKGEALMWGSPKPLPKDPFHMPRFDINSNMYKTNWPVGDKLLVPHAPQSSLTPRIQ